jgi:hypothetical protein
VGIDFGFSLSEGGNITWRTNEAFPLFMGVCGDAFEFVWFPKQRDAEGIGPPEIGDVARSYTAALAASGLSSEVLLYPARTGVSPEALRRRVVESMVERGWPVAFSDVPENGWAFLATGYRDRGRTLTGWAVEGGDDRGIRFEPEAQRTTDDWYGQASAVVMLTARRDREDERVVYRDALQQGLAYLRMRDAGEWLAGAATFEEWADRVADRAVAAGGPEGERLRASVLDPMIWDLATRRHYGALFMERAGELFPDVEGDLAEAIRCFRAEHDLMWEVNRVAGARWPGQPHPKLVEEDVRSRVAELLLESRDLDLEAAGHIEAALARIGVAR